MNDTTICVLACEVKERSGVSAKTGKPYKMKILSIDTERFGVVELVLDTKASRAGIVLDMLRKEDFE